MDITCTYTVPGNMNDRIVWLHLINGIFEEVIKNLSICPF